MMINRAAAAALLRSTAFARAYTLSAFLFLLGQFAVTRLASPVTAHTVTVGLALVGVGVLAVRRAELRLLSFAPTTLVLFVAIACASASWGADASTPGALFDLATTTVVALTIANTRDMLQIVRALGDALRIALATSLGVEVLFGVLLDMPLPILNLAGAITNGGPVQGVFGTRNLLAFVAVTALVTFVIEGLTHSVSRRTTIASLVLGSLMTLLSASPTAVVLLVAVSAAVIALRIVRGVAAGHQRLAQWSLAAIVVVGLGTAYLARHQILRWLDATAGFSLRTDLWNSILSWVAMRPVTGYGWSGQWERDSYPMYVINFLLDQNHGSALNAYFDVLLQLGILGLVVLLGLLVATLVRSWLVASTRRSPVHAWTPLIVVLLMTESMFESFTLSGLGWVLVVVCAIRAGVNRSWRTSLDLAAGGGEYQDPLAPPR